MLPSKRTAASAAAVTLAAVGLIAALAPGAATAKVTVTPGYYSTLVLKSTPSTLVSFTVTKTGEVKDLGLSCGPVSPTLEATLNDEQVSNLEVHGPKLALNGAGGFSYSGPAWISGDGVVKKIGTTTLKITATHVAAPTIHYVFEGTKHSETRAFVGTATSPACIKAKTKSDPFGTPLYHGGQFQLFP
jgi:hypothetical protein